MQENILFLFDIDGTIIEINYAGKHALEYSLKKTFKLNNLLKDISLAGRTDLATFKKVIKNNNINLNKDFKSYWKVFQKHFENKLNEISKNYDWNLIKNIEKFIKIIKNRNAKTGLITGNMKIGAKIKLKMVNMNKYFPVGAFGDEHISRNSIAEKALKRSENFYNQKFTKVAVIGDTPLDIKAGKFLKATTIAITTGNYSYEQLKKYKPDILIKSYNELLSSNFWAAI